MPPQTWNPTDYDQNARFVTDLGAGVMELLDPKPGERVLDLGCGDGILTKKIQDLGCQVVGVDSSPELIQAAQTLGLDARLMDGQSLTFDQEFDAVFSNAALHWMKDQPKMLASVWKALNPGGRFVAEMGGQGNLALIEAALRAVLEKHGLGSLRTETNFYPAPGEYWTLLERQGFKVAMLEHFPRPTLLPKDLKTWLATFRKSIMEAIDPGLRETILEQIQEVLRPSHYNAQGQWGADYVRLRFSALKP